MSLRNRNANPLLEKEPHVVDWIPPKLSAETKHRILQNHIINASPVHRKARRIKHYLIYIVVIVLGVLTGIVIKSLLLS